MPTSTRLAIGADSRSAAGHPLVWGLLDSLDRIGLRVQTFLGRACFEPHDAAGSITGLTPRHLDSWLMSRELARASFARPSSACDVALVLGQWSPRRRWASSNLPRATHGFETLCEWLELPRLMVLDAEQTRGCQLPAPPAGLRGVLLDGVATTREFIQAQTVVESLWNVPVVGGMGKLSAARALVSRLQPGQTPSGELCRAFGSSLEQFTSLDAIWTRWREPAPSSAAACCSELCSAPPHIAVAYDEAFQCYFPDTLDRLEAAGARLTEFSPLRDEALPTDTDMVYLGCGHPELHADRLGDNTCMHSALRNHICDGKRVYAEGGGVAYLCQHLETPGGRRVPMVGALAAEATLNPQPRGPRPVEVSLEQGSWLGEPGTVVRGYLNDYWNLEPAGALADTVYSDEGELTLARRHQVRCTSTSLCKARFSKGCCAPALRR